MKRAKLSHNLVISNLITSIQQRLLNPIFHDVASSSATTVASTGSAPRKLYCFHRTQSDDGAYSAPSIGNNKTRPLTDQRSTSISYTEQKQINPTMALSTSIKQPSPTMARLAFQRKLSQHPKPTEPPRYSRRLLESLGSEATIYQPNNPS